MLADAPLLQYATAPVSWYRRRNVRGALGTILLAVTFAALWLAWSTTPGRWARFVYYQYRCEHYSASPDTVVFSLATMPPYPIFPVNRSKPTPWTAFETSLRASGGSPWNTSVAFLHERQTPTGKHRLIAVDFMQMCGAIYMTKITTFATSWGPPSPVRQPRLATATTGFVNGKLKVFAGQPDPADPTHATIAYTLNDIRGTMELRLRDDDTTGFAITSGPLAPGAAATTATTPVSTTAAVKTASVTRGETFGPAR